MYDNRKYKFSGNMLFWPAAALISLPMVILILLPLSQVLIQPQFNDLTAAIMDKEVLAALGRSLATALTATAVTVIFGTPLAYILARRQFKVKKLVEGLVDLPIMIPHPVIGIAILSVTGKNYWLGRLLLDLGVRVMGTYTGIVLVLTFVGLPFYINTLKAGFENISIRMEKVSRSLGAGLYSTFFRITFPLAWKSMVLGAILCTARAISEFGAVVIVAYHPMTAPVLIFERFTAYGLKYSQPVACWLILISLVLFICMRLFSSKQEER